MSIFGSLLIIIQYIINDKKAYICGKGIKDTCSGNTLKFHIQRGNRGAFISSITFVFFFSKLTLEPFVPNINICLVTFF